jgi:DNA-binding transcriptional ArsR family regulator
MGEAGVLAADGRLADDLLARLEPKLQDALNHPTRREILRVLHAEERPRSIAELAAALPTLKRGEISYHAQVLSNSGCIELEETRPALRQREQLFRSTVGDSDQAQLILRATQQSDREHRQRATETRSPGLLAMFRVPRPGPTIRLLNRRRREAE